MPEAFLDSSVAIGLLFRHAGERQACLAAIPEGATPVCSRYVDFEIARGFLRSLILLYNASFEYESFSNLHQAAHSGQLRFKPYQMATWLGAFVDYFAALEAEDGAFESAKQLEEFRAKLWTWIRRGWDQLRTRYRPHNDIGCREDIPPPAQRSNLRLDQPLPLEECGSPSACRLQSFLARHQAAARDLAEQLDRLPAKQKDSETTKRVEALLDLLGNPVGTAFLGRQCHACGDGLIALEAPPDHVIVTKNAKHFEPIARILGKLVSVARTASTTMAPGA